MTTTTVSVVAPKGGQGASTVAGVLALLAAEDGSRRVLFVSEDAAPIMGIPEHYPEPWHVYDQRWNEPMRWLDAATRQPPHWDGDLTIIDGPDPDADTTIMVVRNCHLALRKALLFALPQRPDQVVLIREAGHALEVRDVAAAVRVPVTTIDADPAVARSVDSGLLASAHLPRSLAPLRFVDLGGHRLDPSAVPRPAGALPSALDRIDRHEPPTNRRTGGLGR